MKKLLLSITFLVMLFAVTSSSYAQQRGYYNAPYTRYEADKGTLIDKAAVSTSYKQEDIAFEASDRTCVNMKNGGAVEWTINEKFKGVVIRYSVEINTGDIGSHFQNVSATYNLYVNNVKVNSSPITVDTYYSWEMLSRNGNNNNNGISNDNWRMRFDETRYLLSQSYPAGTKLKLERVAGNLYIDFVEVEDVAAPIAAPAGAVTYTGNGSDLQTFLGDNIGKTVYIPQGKYDIPDALELNQYTTNKIQGAGIWYTQLHFTNGNSNKGGIWGYNASSISDLYLTTVRNSRSSSYKGINGPWGNGSVIENIWVEHFECGAWIGNYASGWGNNNADNLTVRHCRFRNNYADGINLCQGSRNSVVEYCSFRNNGDDDMAIWPAKDRGKGTCYNNTYRYNTAENCWRASSCALYGGYGNKFHNIIIKDNYEVGIRVNGKFDGYCFGGTAQAANEFYEIDVIGCGTWNNTYGNVDAAVDITTAGACNDINNIKFSCINIKNSNSDALNFRKDGGNQIRNIAMDGITIDGTSKRGYTNNSSWGMTGGIRFVGGPATSDITFCGTITNIETGGETVVNYGKPSNFTPKTTGCTACASETAVDGVSLNKSTMTLCQGADETLTATVTPSDAANQDVKWTSGNESVATVDATGKVTAKAGGTAEITVTTDDGGFTAKCTVTVTATPTVNTITPQTICSGASTTLVTLASTPTGATYSWTSNPTGVTEAQVNGNTNTIPAKTYTTAGVAVGTVIYNITPTLNGCQGTAGTFTVNVNPKPTVNTIQAQTICSGESTALVALSSTPSNATYIWSSTPNNVTGATASGNGNIPAQTLTSTTTGTVVYSITPTLNSCTGTNATFTVTVTNKPTVATPVPAETTLCAGSIINVSAPTVEMNGSTQTSATWKLGGTTIVPSTYTLTAADNGKLLTYEVVSNCGTTTSTGVSITVNDVPAQPSIITGDANTTKGTTGLTYSVTNVPGVTYTWSFPSGWTITAGGSTNSVTVDATATAVSGTITVTPSNSCGNGTAQTLTVTVTDPTFPVASISVNPGTLTFISVEAASQSITETVLPANATDKSVVWSSDNENVATVDQNGNVTPVGVGTAVITVTTNDGGHTATCNVTVNAIPVTDVELNKNATTITLGSDETLIATITPANATNKNVAWSSSNPAIADVDQSGKVTAKGVGTATITVTTADGSHTDACMVTVNTNVINVISVALNKNTTTLTVGDDETLTATINPSNATDKTVKWTSSDDLVAIVDQSGKITTVSVGTATITVETTDGGHTDACVVTVIPVSVTGVTLNKNTTTLTVGDEETLTATVTPADAADQTVSWLSSEPSVATVDTNGKVIALSPGTTTITVKTTDGGHTDVCVVTVNATVVAVTGITITPTSKNIVVGETFTITVDVQPANATNKDVIFSVESGDYFADVDQTGLVTGLNCCGTATIRVTTDDGGFYKECTVFVGQGTINVTAVDIDPKTKTIAVNETFNVTATVTPNNATNQDVTYSIIGDTNIADVDPVSGLVTGKATGQVTVRATTTDGGFTDDCIVTVVANSVNVTAVAISPKNQTINVGGTFTATAVITPSNATNQDVTYSIIGDTNIASVDPTGIVTGLAVGQVTVRVTTTDGGFTDDCVVTVSAGTINVISVSLNKNATTIIQGLSETLIATINPTNATDKTVIWKSSNPAVATIDGNGKVTAASVGTTTITVTTTDGNKTASCVVTVQSSIINVTGVNISTTNKAIGIGETFTLYASVTPANATNQAVVYSIVSGGTYISLNTSTGLITGLAEGTAKVRVTTVDGGKTAECTVTVTKSTIPVSGISINPGSATIKIGEELQVTATVFPSNAANKTITYSVISGSAYISFNSATGVVRGLLEGTAIIRATSADGGHSVDCTIKVERVAVNGITIPDVYVSIGGTTTIVPVFTPANPTNKNVTYTIISGEEYIDIDPNTGYVTAWAAGTAVVRVTTADGNKTATFNITVYNPAVGIPDVNGNISGKTIIAYDKTIQVDGLVEGEIISVYNLSGIRNYVQKATQKTEYIQVRIPGMYTVVIEGSNVSEKVLITK